MITLLASIVGFIGSIIPEVLKILKERSDKQYALNILDKKIEISTSKNFDENKDCNFDQLLNERSVLYSTYSTGVVWVDALNGTVRPILAYSFFIMYAFTKYMQYKVIGVTGFIVTHLDILWSLNDQAIFASITSFYFGHRTFSKMWKKRSS